MQKVTLYVRERVTRRYKRAKSKFYQPGTTFVLRYGGEWETLPEGTTLSQADVAALGKSIEIRTGKVEKPRPKPKPQHAPQALDVLVDKYLEVRAMQNNWRKHTRQAYALALKLFLRSCRKTRLDDITDDDLRDYATFLRKYRTSTGKRYDDRLYLEPLQQCCYFPERARPAEPGRAVGLAEV
jgi:hypothetical protein